MLERLPRPWRNAALALLAFLVLWFAWTVRAVLNPLILGYLLAYIVHPMVLNLEERGWRRRTAVNFIYISAGLATVILATGLVVQARALITNAQVGGVGGGTGPGLVENAVDRIEEFTHEYDWMFEWLVEGEEDPEDPDSEPDAEPDAGASGATGAPGSTGSEGSGEAAGGRTELGGADSERDGSEPGDTRTGGQEPGDVEEPAIDSDPGPPAGADLGPDDEPAGTVADGTPATEVDETAAAPTPGEDPFALVNLVSALFDRVATEQKGGELALQGAGGAWRLVQRWFGSLMALATLISLLPIYCYFLLFELGRIHTFLRRHVPKRERDRVARIGHQIGEVLANFFRGRMLVCLLKGLFLALGLAIAGVDYALLLGILGGFLSLIPFLGPFFGFLFAFSIALLDPEGGFLRALLATSVVFVLAEILEGYWLVPKILGDTLGLHPIVVMASVFVGGAALGMFGFLIALPLAASLVILARELVLPALQAWADEDDDEEEAGATEASAVSAASVAEPVPQADES